ncbi:small-conductance mechanosensitive channel [Thermonema lapsum]|uniref:Small-conductance mechanosensitive channel n=1 Tax=Thermonema lapsum TaxID=28195 RepID=A0A846MS52_9BACT|nr:mechanosensitive ion channel family protein [Thermonema lapsum]NIK74424.1 small-conductance mechanosensitive channel [Thermonema lapsum]
MSIKELFEYMRTELPFTLSIALIVIAYFAGRLLERVIIPWLQKLAHKSRTNFDDILVKSLRHKLTWLLVILSFHLSVHFFHFDNETESILRHQLLPSFYIAILTLFLQGLIAELVQNTIRSVPGLQLPSTSLFSNLIRIIVICIGATFILDVWEVSLAPILTALGVGGLAVALALQDTLANFFAGVQIIVSKKVRPGDYVVLDSGQEGFVQDISWRNTALLSPQNNYIIIPNSKLGSAIVTNFNSNTPELLMPVTVGVSYDSDLEFVEKVTKEVAKEVMSTVEGGDPSYEPFMNFHTFNNSSIDFTIRLKCLGPQYRLKLVHAFIKALHKRYGEVGINIPFPIRTVYMRNLSNTDNKA